MDFSHIFLHIIDNRLKLAKKSKYVAFIDDDTIVRFDEFDSVFNEPIADEMICLRGNPIQHDNPTYHGKYHIWYDQEKSLKIFAFLIMQFDTIYQTVAQKIIQI